MKLIIVLSLVAIELTIQAACSYSIGKEIHNTYLNYSEEKTQIQAPRIRYGKQLVFKDNQGCFGSYISLDIDFSLIRPVYKQLNKVTVEKLKSRGESHITLLTPPEFQHFFASSGISMTVLKEFVIERFSANTLEFDVKAIGSGHIESQSTYFLIVVSQDLKNLRLSLADLLVGEKREAFLETGFYPHITLGFNKTDLHISQGIRKDSEFSKDNRFELVVK